MRVIIYSDLQLHPYKEFHTLVGGINDRLLDHMNVLEDIRQYALQHNIKHILCGGDVFDARAKVDVIAAKLLADWKWQVSKDGITQIDVLGNHDMYDKSTTHNAIELYAHYPNQHIIDKPQWVIVEYDYMEPKAVLCIPYMHRLEDIKAAFELEPPTYAGVPVRPDNAIAIVHYGLYDVPTETHGIIRDQGYDTEGQVRLSDLEPLLKRVKHVFFGHFHITTDVTKRIHFIGTPLQHKWGERLVDTDFLDVDLSTGTFKRIQTKAPRFVEFESLHDVDTVNKDIFIKGNFCRVKVAALEEREPARDKLLACGARGADAIVVKKKQEATTRLGLDLSMSFEEMGARMVEADSETKLDKNKLKNVLADALKAANQRLNG